MKKKLSVEDIIYLYLKSCTPIKVTNVMLQTKLPEYGVQYGVWHSPETYARAWRKIKETMQLKDIEIIEIKDKEEYLCKSTLK